MGFRLAAGQIECADSASPSARSSGRGSQSRRQASVAEVRDKIAVTALLVHAINITMTEHPIRSHMDIIKAFVDTNVFGPISEQPIMEETMPDPKASLTDPPKDMAPKKPSSGPPIVVVRDMQIHDSGDLPDEYLEELIRIVGHT